MAEFQGTRVMKVNEHGDEEQVYPQTTADAVIGLRDFILQVMAEEDQQNG